MVYNFLISFWDGRMADGHIKRKQKEKTALSSASDMLRSRYGEIPE